MQRDSFKRPPMKKEATPKNTNGLVQKTSDKKRQAQKIQRGSFKRPPIKKRQSPKNAKRFVQKGSPKRPPMSKEAIIAKV
jgi:hypothetical protein